jgi:MFS superfamily sulfate permease-like transporter
MKRNLNIWTKLFIAAFCFGIAIVGFMLKLPSMFRGMDKEMHAAFYFLAAAFLNILFAKRNLIIHVVIFGFLYMFGYAIERAQEYSNKFFHKRIHGRFDPEDMEWNLKGLVSFSVIWIIYTAIRFLLKKPSVKVKSDV